MAITISGENNNDKIIASDGVIDSLSPLSTNLTGDVTGNLTGNVTGNINNTTLLLQTGGYERIRINSNGSIQITPEASTSNPYALIDTSGDSVRLHAKKDSGNNEFRFLTQSSGTVDERFRISSNGRVAVGNATNNANTNALFKAVADDGEAADLYVGQFVNLEATAGQSYGVNIQAGSNSTDHGFRVRNRANNTTQFLVRGDGNVGIGTDNPFNPLEVVGSSVDLMLYDTQAYSQNSSGPAVAFAGNDSAGNRKTFADVRGVANGANIGEFAIRTRGTGGNLTEALRIDSDGNVTKPKNTMFKAMMTASYNPGSTGWKTIPYNTDSQTACFDIGGNFDTSTHRFTAPVDGYYFFGLNQRVDSGDSNYFRVAFGLDGDYNSGGDYPYGHAIYKDADAFSFYSFSITSLNYMTAGQYMIAMGYSNTDTNFYWQNESIFYGYLVG